MPSRVTVRPVRPRVVVGSSYLMGMSSLLRHASFVVRTRSAAHIITQPLPLAMFPRGVRPSAPSAPSETTPVILPFLPKLLEHLPLQCDFCRMRTA